MALTRVQSNTATGNSTAPSVDIGIVPVSGDLVVVSVMVGAIGRTITLAGFTEVPTDSPVAGTTNVTHAVFYKTATGVAGTDVITAAVSGTAVNWRIIATQYHDSGGGAWTLDKSAHNSGSSGTADSGTTATTSSAAEIWVGVLSNSGSGAQSAPTNGFTLVQGANVSSRTSYLYDKIVAATAAANVAATLAGTPVWVGTVAAFYAGAGAGTPANTAAPAVTGTTTVGQTLSCSTGSWTNTPTSFSYQWQRDAHGDSVYSDIGGATSNTRVLADTDDACKLRCRVIATNATGSSTPTTSNASGAVVEPAPANLSAPVATGHDPLTPRARMTTTSGTWSNMSGYQPEFAYQWQSSPNGTSGWADIPGATFGSYVLHTVDIGDYFRCVVNAGNTGAPL